MAAAGRLDETRAEQGIREALMVMVPYVRKMNVWPASDGGRSELLRHILAENGSGAALCEMGALRLVQGVQFRAGTEEVARASQMLLLSLHVTRGPLRPLSSVTTGRRSRRAALHSKPLSSTSACVALVTFRQARVGKPTAERVVTNVHIFFGLDLGAPNLRSCR